MMQKCGSKYMQMGRLARVESGLTMRADGERGGGDVGDDDAWNGEHHSCCWQDLKRRVL